MVKYSEISQFSIAEEYTKNWLVYIHAYVYFGELFGASENPTRIHGEHTQLRFWWDELSQLSFTQSPESHHP